MKNLTRKIIVLLKQHDIEGLLALGAPSDEYDDEAVRCAQAIYKLDVSERTFEHVLLVFSQIWSDEFNLNEEDMLMRKENIIAFVRELTSSEEWYR